MRKRTVLWAEPGGDWACTTAVENKATPTATSRTKRRFRWITSRTGAISLFKPVAGGNSLLELKGWRGAWTLWPGAREMRCHLSRILLDPMRILLRSAGGLHSGQNEPPDPPPSYDGLLQANVGAGQSSSILKKPNKQGRACQIG